MLAAVAAALETEAGSACIVDPDGVVVWVNAAWDRFAEANGGAPGALGSAVVGTRFVDHLAGGEVRSHHLAAFAHALRMDDPSPPGGLVMVGECNSPSTARLVTSCFAPLRTPKGELLGVSAVYTVLREAPIGECYPPVTSDPDAYRAASGLIRQCACCRRVRRPGEPACWDLVPALVAARHPHVSHGICPLCIELHYPSASRSWRMPRPAG